MAAVIRQNKFSRISFQGHDDLTQGRYMSIHPFTVRPSARLSIRPSQELVWFTGTVVCVLHLICPVGTLEPMAGTSDRN